MVNIDYDNNINNEPYDQLNNEPYYNPYEGKYLQNISNNITDITISGNIMPLEYFILSFCFIYCGCRLYDRYKKIKNNRSSDINIDSLNTLIVCNELPDNNCSICLEDFKDEDILKKLNCNHIFHKECLTPWLNDHNNCPLCRCMV